MGQPTRGHARVLPSESIGWAGVSGGTETSQYPEEETSTEIPLVVVSERGPAQTTPVPSLRALLAGGCRTRWGSPQGSRRCRSPARNRTAWDGRPERVTVP